MYLIYVDEAGNTGMNKDPDQPVHMLGAMIVEEEKVEPLAKGVWDISRRNFRSVCHEKGFELHGKDLFSGDGLFKGVDPSVRISACREVVELLHEHEVDVMFTGLNKMDYVGDEHPHALAFKFMIERLQDHLDRNDALGLIIADENKEVEERLIEDLIRAKEHGTQWGYRPTRIENIVDSVHFVQSVKNRNMQAIDVVTYFVNKASRNSKRLLKDFMTSDRSVTFPVYKAAHMRPADTVVAALHDRIMLRSKAWKMWP